MAQTFGNPYQPATAIGSGLQNIAIGLFGGRGRGSTRDPALDAAHTALYNEQTAAKAVERQLNERLLQDQGGDAQDELIAARTGLPVHSVKGYRRALQTGGNLEEYAPYANKLSDAMLAIRPAYADKSVNPVNIADALLKLNKDRDIRSVIAGTQDPTRTSQAHFSASGAAPFDNTAVGTMNKATGVETLNQYGTQKVDTEKRHGTAYSAAAGASSAAARASSARAAQTELETKTGVKVGAPVFVDDGKGGVTYASPIAAVGGGSTAGPRPTAPPVKAVLNPDGTTTWEHAAPGTGQQVGTTPPRPATPRPPRKVSSTDKKMMETAVADAAAALEVDPADLSPSTRSAILAQAEIEFAGGAAGHHNAVVEAFRKMAPDGFELTGTWGARKLTPKGGPRAVEKPVPGRDGPAPRPAAATPAAPAPAATAGGPVVPKISSDAEYNALPKGAEYIAPDGVRRRKK